MVAGYMVSIANQSTGNITVGLATATATIDTVTNATATVSAKEVRTYLVNSAANGYSTNVWFKPPLTLATEQATTSGTAINFTRIPKWVKRITIMLDGVSANNNLTGWLVQIGDSGSSYATSGYQSSAVLLRDSWAIVGRNSTAGFLINADTATASLCYGTMVLTLEDAVNGTWIATATVKDVNGVTHTMHSCAGAKTLSATLDRLRLTTNTADTFDAGAMNILYE